MARIYDGIYKMDTSSTVSDNLNLVYMYMRVCVVKCMHVCVCNGVKLE